MDKDDLDPGGNDSDSDDETRALLELENKYI